MSEKMEAAKRALAIAESDRTSEVIGAHNGVVSVLNRVEMGRLGEADRASVKHVAATLEGVVQEFKESLPAHAAAASTKVEELKKFNMIRRLVELGALIVVLMIFGRSAMVAFLLLVVLLIGRSVAKKRFMTGAHRAAVESWHPYQEALGVIGHDESAYGGSSGLFAQADALMLKSMDSMERMMEMQRRQAQRQEWASERRHQEQLAALQQQAAVQQAMLMEQRDMVDAQNRGRREAQRNGAVLRDMAYNPAKERYRRNGPL